MGNRSTILLVVLVLLVCAAGYWYAGSIQQFAGQYPALNSALRTVGLPPLKKALKPSEVSNRAIQTYRNTLIKTLPVESIDWVKLSSARGIDSRLSFTLRNGTNPGRSKTSVQGSIELRAFVDGDARADLRLSDTDTHQYDSASLAVNDGRVFVSIPAIGLRTSSSLFVSQDSAPIGPGLGQFKTAEPKSISDATFRGQDAKRVDFKPVSGRRLSLFVSAENTNVLLGVRVTTRGTRFERRVKYGDNSATLSAIETYRDKTLLTNVTLSRQNGTLLVNHGNPNANFLKSIRLELPSRSSDDLSGPVSVETTLFETPLQLGRLTISMNDGLPDGFQFEFSIESSDTFPLQLSGSMESDYMDWLKETSNLSLEPESYRKNSLPELFGNIVRKNEARLARRAKQRKKRRNKKRNSASDTPGVTEQSDESDTVNKRRKVVKIPYPDLKKAPRESGETIYRSKSTQFPYTEPPETFSEAKKHYYAGEYQQAREKLESLIRRYPRSVNVNYLLGVIYYYEGYPSLAEKYFNRVFELRHDPQLREWSRQYLQEIEDTGDSVQQSTG
ncbi:MAG: tol-pal system YbgF family protein [bacterium]